jgi:hypothetical protein
MQFFYALCRVFSSVSEFLLNPSSALNFGNVFGNDCVNKYLFPVCRHGISV